MLSELSKLVSIPSTYPSEKNIGDYVHSMLKKNGIKVQKQYIDTHRFNVLAEKGTGPSSILLYAHLDTVGVVDGWKTDPFALTVKGDKAYGLGAWDMKAGLVANLITFLNTTSKRKIKLAICVDEENISTGGYKLINSSFMKDVACVISTEPAFAHGLQGVVVGRIGRAVFDVTIRGKSYHFAKYNPQIDISYPLSDFIQKLKKMCRINGDKKEFVFIRKIESHTVGMSVPENVHLQLDASILPPHTTQTMLERIRLIAQTVQKKHDQVNIDITLHPRTTPFLNPYSINEGNAYLSHLKKSIRAVTGKRAIPYFRSSVADENIFGAEGITTLGIGPVGEGAHSANEYVLLSSVTKLINILSEFIHRA